MAKKTTVGNCEYHGEYFMDDEDAECPSCQDGSFCENCGQPAEYDPDMILCDSCASDALKIEAGQQLAQMFSNLADAMAEGWKKRQEQLKIHDAVMDSLPDEPERGSYYWWARIARQNTGSSLCDSGSAYSYQYMRGVLPEDGPHLHLEVWHGRPEYWRINLVKFLETMLEADDPTAVALENVLMWAGKWLYPREHWYKITSDLGAILNLLYACILKRGDSLVFRKWARNNLTLPIMDTWHRWAGRGEVGVRIFAEWIVRYYLGKLVYKSDFYDWQWEMVDDQFVSAALDALPVDDVKRLYEDGVKWESGGFYTYNHDNDLDQDLHVDAEFSDDYGDWYAIVRTHNGCDARGGFSDPVVAKVTGPDYFRDWQVDGYCFQCHEQFYDWYDYGKKVKQAPQIDVQPYRAYFAAQTAAEAGQMTLPEMPEDLPLDVPEGYARALVDYYNRQIAEEIPKEDIEFPVVMFKFGEQYLLDDEAQGNVPNENVAGLYCPECGCYSVGFHCMVYGF